MSPALRITEEQWQQQVIDLAQALGWVCAHFRPAKTERGWRTAVQADGAGFPDLVLVRAPRLIFAELKSATGRVSPDQRRWLEALGAVGEYVDTGPGLVSTGGAVETHVWRPGDWDEVAETLKRTETYS